MIYAWYLIFNLTEFLNTQLVSRELDIDLQDIGQASIQITKGVGVSIVYDGVMLAINMNQKNPFEFEGYAVYLDAKNDVYLGKVVPDEN